jgi:hypothetical protein
MSWLVPRKPASLSGVGFSRRSAILLGNVERLPQGIAAANRADNDRALGRCRKNRVCRNANYSKTSRDPEHRKDPSHLSYGVATGARRCRLACS